MKFRYVVEIRDPKNGNFLIRKAGKYHALPDEMTAQKVAEFALDRADDQFPAKTEAHRHD